jgi:ThiF family
MDLQNRLGNCGDPETDASFRPVLLDPSKQRQDLERLLESGQVHRVRDTIDDQHTELVDLRRPSQRLSPPDLAALVREHLGGTPQHLYGTWAYYPWRRELVHVLAADEFREVRGDRNRERITRDEQASLRKRTIGIVGLSVGGAIALSLAQEGVGGRFRIADFDALSLSNLNRLRSSVADLGLNKAVLAARAMYELDPYLDVDVYAGGLDDASVARFFEEAGRLDLVVEECDDIRMKLAVRERARAQGIPVLMWTGEGLLDIERFDREPERPILHGLLGTMRSEDVRRLPPPAMIPIVLAVVGAETVSARAAASGLQVGQTVKAQAQLASMVILGGGVVTDVARRIFLDELHDSGRFLVRPDVVRDGGGTLAAGAPPPEPTDISPDAKALVAVPPRPSRTGVVDRDAVRFVVGHAILAPSGHNAQPWAFRFGADGTLLCRYDRAHAMPMIDFGDRGAFLAFGAMLENLTIAARAIGLEPAIATFPDKNDQDVIASVSFTPRAVEETKQLELIRQRITNRKLGDGVAPPADLLSSLTAMAEASGGRLQIVTDTARRTDLGRLVGVAERIAMLNPRSHPEMMGGMRLTRTAVESTRDGLDAWAAEADPIARAGMKIMMRGDVAAMMRKMGVTTMLEQRPAILLKEASAAGLLSVRGAAPLTFVASGRLIQQLWLTAQEKGYYLHPMTILPSFFARLENGGDGFAEDEARDLAAARTRFDQVFERRAGESEVFLFRMFRADAPTARSLRRPVDSVLTLG